VALTTGVHAVDLDLADAGRSVQGSPMLGLERLS